jgi:hypothetical protein
MHTVSASMLLMSPQTLCLMLTKLACLNRKVIDRVANTKNIRVTNHPNILLFNNLQLKAGLIHPASSFLSSLSMIWSKPNNTSLINNGSLPQEIKLILSKRSSMKRTQSWTKLRNSKVMNYRSFKVKNSLYIMMRAVKCIIPTSNHQYLILKWSRVDSEMFIDNLPKQRSRKKLTI